MLPFVAVAAVELVIGVQNVVAYGNQMSAHRLLEMANLGVPVSTQVADQVATQASWSSAWLPDDPALGYTAGLVWGYAASQPNRNTDEARQLLSKAAEQFRLAIKAAPSRSYTWAALALADSSLGAPLPKVQDLLRLSVELGPHEPRSRIYRMSAIFNAYDVMPEPLKEAAAHDVGQILLAYPGKRDFVVFYNNSSIEVRQKLLESAVAQGYDTKWLMSIIKSYTNS